MLTAHADALDRLGLMEGCTPPSGLRRRAQGAVLAAGGAGSGSTARREGRGGEGALDAHDGGEAPGGLEAALRRKPDEFLCAERAEQHLPPGGGEVALPGAAAGRERQPHGLPQRAADGVRPEVERGGSDRAAGSRFGGVLRMALRKAVEPEPGGDGEEEGLAAAREVPGKLFAFDPPPRAPSTATGAHAKQAR